MPKSGKLPVMLQRHWWHISLARKISLLFGTAIMLTICVTLAFPWLHMTNLNEQALLMRARWVATAAHESVDLRQPDWDLMRRQLEQPRRRHNSALSKVNAKSASGAR